MKTMKATRKALATSIVALVVCVTMLMGTTFAWFTDTATVAVNKIQSGNLDIVLEYLNAEGEWEETTDQTKLFNDEALWEPGHTEVAYLKISNKGNLAIKYRLAANVANEVQGTNVAGEPFNLSDYIKLGVIDSETEITPYATREDAQKAVEGKTTKLMTYTKEGQLLVDEQSEVYLALVVYMPSTVGNEANYKAGTTAPSIELGVNVVATQATYESDSFDEKYDESANYPIVTPEQLKEAIEDPTVTKIEVAGGKYTETVTVPEGKTLTSQNGSFDTTSDPDYSPALDLEDNSILILNGGTYAGAGMQTINAQADNAKLTINDGTYHGSVAVWTCGTTEVIINGGVFNTWALAVTDTGAEYPVIVNGGTFNLGNGGIDANTGAPIVINGGTFNVDPTNWLAEGKTAVVNSDGTWTVE